MLGYLVLGGGLAFAAVLQPGPLQAFLLSRAAVEGWKRTLPAALSPLLSDGPIALLVLLVLDRLPVHAQLALRAAGGLLLLFLAWSAARTLGATRDTPAPAGDAAPRTLLQAASVNLLNPNPWLAWALVLGPTVVSAWKQGPLFAVAFVAAFYGVMVTGLGLFILVASTARFLPPRARRALVGLSAAVLAALGAWQLFAGLRAIVPG
ncbi:MAG: LysE family transporter [Holophagales bacterium]|nr:LysE family transporter [Holophagales bacterium]